MRGMALAIPVRPWAMDRLHQATRVQTIGARCIRGHWVWGIRASVSMDIRFERHLRVESTTLCIWGSHCVLFKMSLEGRSQLDGTADFNRARSSCRVPLAATVFSRDDHVGVRRGPIRGKWGLWRDWWVHHTAATAATYARARGVMAKAS